MASTFTPALHLEMPARGDYVNSWDLPANSNYSQIDLGVGGTTAITGLTGGTTNLTQAQANSMMLTLAGSLTSNLVITYPSTSQGRKLIFPGLTLNGFSVAIRGNGGSDAIGVIMLFSTNAPTPILVTASRVFWDYGPMAPGFIGSYPNNSVPNGWLPCDGRLISTTQYDLLFAVLGYNYGGSGGNFAVPDYRGYADVCSDTMGTPAGSAGRFFNFGPGNITGATTETLSQAEMPVHSHTVADPTHTHPASQPAHSHGGVITGFAAGGNFAAGAGWQLVTGNSATAQPAITVSNAATGISIGTTGGSGSHNNVQPSRTRNAYIKW